MSLFIRVAVYGGIAAMIVAGSIVGGIIANVINDGDHHKEKMTTSPPPPAPPPGARMRAMSEHEEIYGKRGSHFDLSKEERKVFTTLAARQAMGMKR